MNQAAALLILAPLTLSAAQPAPGGESAHSLFNPTPTAEMRAMNTDRPDTTESPFTVDAGHIQIESSFIDYNRDRAAGVKTETWILGQTNLKIGLLDRTDLQIVCDPYVLEKTGGTGTNSTANGIGDTVIRLKQNLWGGEGDTTTAFALMPWISTRSGSSELRSSHHEGGLIAPLSATVSDTVSTAVMIQADMLWDAAAGKYFVDWTHTNTWSFGLTDSLGIFTEYVGRHRSGTGAEYRASTNIGLTYATNANLILDAGVRIGLNSRADDFGAFSGISYRH